MRRGHASVGVPGPDVWRSKRILTLLLLIAAMVTVSLLPRALSGGGASSVFRPPVSSDAHLSDAQRLELTLNALNQQLVFGEIRKGIVEPDVVSKGLISLVQDSASESRGQTAVLSSGDVLGMVWDNPGVDSDVAAVPVRLLLREQGAEPGSAKIAEVKDTLYLEQRSAGRWVLALPALKTASAVRTLLKRPASGKTGSTGVASASVSSLGGFAGLESDSMLLPKSLHSEASVLNSTTSNSLFEHNIMHVPWGIAAVQTYDYLGNHHYHEYLAVSDRSLCRMLGADNTEGWIRAHGSGGDGPDRFRLPMGVCGDGHTFWICDAFSNRVVQYTLMVGYNNETIAPPRYDREFTANFNYPTDVDWRGDPYHSWMVVADNGHGQIKRFRSGIFDRAFGSSGSGPQQFINPTSVSFGRDLTGAHTVEFFVADNGNARLTSVDSNAAYPNFVWRSADLPGTNLTSVDVDNFGNVYALDATEGKIYKFSNLLVPLGVCAIGSTGPAIDPKCFAIVHGQDCRTGGCIATQPGDALLTQRYTSETGVHRFGLGVNVLRMWAAYDPKNDYHPNTSYLIFDYHLTDAAESVKLEGWYVDGPSVEKFFDSTAGPQVAGPQRVAVTPLYGIIPNGPYVALVIAKSIYSGSNVDTATDFITIDDSFNQVPTIVSGPTPIWASQCDTCLRDYWPYQFMVQASDPDGSITKYE